MGALIRAMTVCLLMMAEIDYPLIMVVMEYTSIFGDKID